jgi:hypothetical protein
MLLSRMRLAVIRDLENGKKEVIFAGILGQADGDSALREKVPAVTLMMQLTDPELQELYSEMFQEHYLELGDKLPKNVQSP